MGVVACITAEVLPAFVLLVWASAGLGVARLWVLCDRASYGNKGQVSRVPRLGPEDLGRERNGGYTTKVRTIHF